MKFISRTFVTSSQDFENKTKLSYRVMSSNNVMLTHSTQKLLHRQRATYTEFCVFFEDSNISESFLTSSPLSFEALIMNNRIANYLPKLPAGIKQPDEFYLHMDKKIAFIIEKKTQTVSGSVSEKIQTAPFKKIVMSDKFKKG